MNKDPWDWEEEDIETLIKNEIQENLNLDYKRCASLEGASYKKDLSKDVSAFANSAGGVIIYGVIEKGHIPINIDAGYDPTVVTREWLEQVINSTIQRRIDGVRIKQIELKKKNPGKVIYVVNVPQSRYAPHMAEDHRYYKRFNYQSVPMEEYEVRDVSNRSDAPDLSLQFYLEDNSVKVEFEGDADYSKPIVLKPTIINESRVPAMYYIVRIGVDKRVRVSGSGRFNHGSEESIQIRDKQYVVKWYYKNFSVNSSMPVWQNISFVVSDPNTAIALPNNIDEFYALTWSIDSIGMQQKNGTARLLVTNGQVKVV
jgi:hypothetical protein